MHQASRRPINKYHVLVIPRLHFESFVDLPDATASHLFLMAKRLSVAVRQVCRADAISHLSDDDVTGTGFNIISHYKFHIIPRYKDDRVEINWNREPDPGVKVRSEYQDLRFGP